MLDLGAASYPNTDKYSIEIRRKNEPSFLDSESTSESGVYMDEQKKRYDSRVESASFEVGKFIIISHQGWPLAEEKSFKK